METFFSSLLAQIHSIQAKVLCPLLYPCNSRQALPRLHTFFKYLCHLYCFVCHSSFLGKGGLALCLESYREFSNTYFSDCVCVLNVTTRLLEAVHFYCFQNPCFLNNVLLSQDQITGGFLRRVPRKGIKGGLPEKWINQHSKAMSAAKAWYTSMKCVIFSVSSVASHPKIFPSTRAYPGMSLEQAFLCVLCHFVNDKKVIISFIFLDHSEAL